MTNNDFLRRFRYALDISNPTMLKIFGLSNHDMSMTTLLDILKKEIEPGYIQCDDYLLTLFLDGLIIFKRGVREPAQSSAIQPDVTLTNNDILKKIRIALELREEDLMEIMRTANVTISKSELNALFRSKGQKNYKPCGDQFMRSLLQGLSRRFRGAESGELRV